MLYTYVQKRSLQLSFSLSLDKLIVVFSKLILYGHNLGKFSLGRCCRHLVEVGTWMLLRLLFHSISCDTNPGDDKLICWCAISETGF